MKPIWGWLFAVIAVLLWLFAWKCGWPAYRDGLWGTPDFVDKLFGCFLAIVSVAACVVAAVLAAVLGSGLGILIGSLCAQDWKQCSSSPLVSMRNSDGQTGSFAGGLFMVVGQIGQSSTYFYYTATQDGGLRQNKWNPDENTTIYEEDRTDGKVIQFHSQFHHSWLNWIASPDGEVRMEFHIPRGTVRKDFQLN